MAQLAIKGHATRGKEVIEILEMLGGKNKYLCQGLRADRMYLIHDFGNIEDICSTYEQLPNYQVYTLEQFLEKFPYKVEDKVKVCGDNLGVIVGMRWEIDYVVYKVKLSKNGYETSKTSENLQPYKEETMEEQKKYYDEWFQTDYLEFENNDDTWADEVEVNLGKDYEIQIRGDKTFIVKKKSQYPKTYEECCKILNISPNGDIIYSGLWVYGGEYLEKHLNRLRNFQQLLICRDAYWKIAGEQMGLGKPWEPDWLNTEQDKFVLYTHNNVICSNRFVLGHNVLAFPTVEMRNAFYENFKDLIEACKELL